MRKYILNQPIDTENIDEAVRLSKNALTEKKQLKIITLNPEMVINALKNQEFKNALDKSELIVPDGTGIIWALKKIYGSECKNIKRIPGIELAEKILSIADELGKKVSIFGGKLHTLNTALKKLKEKHKNIRFVKSFDGYQSKTMDKKIAEEIADEMPDVVFVALGTPRQEIWINKYSYLFPNSIMIGIGGSLDVWSGEKPRAPKWVRKMHLEWLYRILIAPERIPRVLKSLPRFVWMVTWNVILSRRRRIS